MVLIFWVSKVGLHVDLLDENPNHDSHQICHYHDKQVLHKLLLVLFKNINFHLHMQMESSHELLIEEICWLTNWWKTIVRLWTILAIAFITHHYLLLEARVDLLLTWPLAILESNLLNYKRKQLLITMLKPIAIPTSILLIKK